ncbi:MAG: adenosylcobinamide-GDP ribazoletransferase, partial [Candidatus Omnitrophica bacterium]|nr:adenosylcobinamide-GDP ribazoletransferase [Candidatus Omnitrophota bacterium]
TKSTEKVLEIMKDSRIGVMGVTGVTCLLLLKFALIAEMPNAALWRALILMVVFSRWIQVLACYKSNYVRKEGKAKYFIEYNSKNEFLIGGAFTVILFTLLMGMVGLILFAISLVPVLMFISYSKRKIGGMTGDTVGAVSEIAEGCVLFLTLVLARLCI